MSEPQQNLTIEPQDLVFQDVRFNTTYTKSVEITNNVNAPVELQIRSGSSDRFTVTPAVLTIQPQATAQATIQLRVLRYANKAKCIEQGQRDTFYIKVCRA